MLFCIKPFLAQQDMQQEMPVVPEDIACAKGPNAVTWGSVKQRFRKLIEEHSGPFSLAPREHISNAINGAIADIRAVKGFDKEECGFGKLFIQVLSMLTMDDPSSIAQFLQETPVMASPILTLLLDIPWMSTALSGWPFFGMLAQLAMHKVNLLTGVLNNDAVDGLADDTARTFFTEISSASQREDLATMYQASNKYLSYMEKSNSANALGQMTALATETVMQTDVKQRMESVQWLQQQMRKIISTPAELDLALTSRWPLWGALHLSVDAFATAA